MSGGRTYVDKVTIGTVNVFEVASDPNGALTAKLGDFAIRSDVPRLYQNTDGAMAWRQVVQQVLGLADVGDGATIPVVTSVSMDVEIGAAAETNTVALPTFVGQELTFRVSLDGGGTREITFSNSFNTAGQTIITFDSVFEYAKFESFFDGGTGIWRLIVNDGGVLS